MDGKKQADISVLIHEFAYRSHVRLHGRAKTLTPVGGQQDSLHPRGRSDQPANVEVYLEAAEHRLERIYDRITGDKDLFGGDILIEQVGAVAFGSGEMKRRDVRDKPAVHLLRERAHYVPGPQPRLDVADRYPAIKACHCPGERSR